MKEFRVTWKQCPMNFHDEHVLFVEAECEVDAKLIARDHVERRYAVAWFEITGVREVKAIPAGRVKEYKECNYGC